jgi:hypothetical protein
MAGLLPKVDLKFMATATESGAADAWPKPVSLVWRLVLATTLVLGLAHSLQRHIVGPLIPAFRATITFLDDSFVVNDARLERDGPNETVSFKGNLARPVSVAGQMLYPFGSAGIPPGYAQVDCTLGGALEYGSLLLIACLAWPAKRAGELALRLLLSAPLLLLIVLIGVPTTVIAELWNSFEQDANVHRVSHWMIWSRFLMGGGGLVLALVFAGAAITVATRLTSRTRPAAGRSIQ